MATEVFFIEIIQPFLDLEGTSKFISQHPQKNHNTKFCQRDNGSLVKIDWWFDVTNKIDKQQTSW